MHKEMSPQRQVDEALKRAKTKKALYIYNNKGFKRLIGVFEEEKAERVKRVFESQGLDHRLSEHEVKTTEADTEFTGFWSKRIQTVINYAPDNFRVFKSKPREH